MAGRPKQRKVLAALLARARKELGEDSTALDYAIGWVANGGTVLGLAKSLENELKESVSRSFLSGTLHGCAPDASDRLLAARREGSHAMIEETLTIVHDTPATNGDVQKARLIVGTRQWMAERYNRQDFGETKASVQISLGALHFDALRQREQMTGGELANDSAPVATLVSGSISSSEGDSPEAESTESVAV